MEGTDKPGSDAAGGARGPLSELGPVRRVVLKLSGESLAGEAGYGIGSGSLETTATQVLEAVEAEASVEQDDTDPEGAEAAPSEENEER